MAIGKGKKKRGGKKKIVDPFTRKDWYDLKAPAMFSNRDIGKTPVNKTVGNKLSRDSLIGRVVEVCLADLQRHEDHSYRQIKLKVEDIQGKNCLTNFHGMRFTTDKLCSLVRKWQSLIEAHVDIRTTDGYVMRMFCIGFTKRRPNQQKMTCYAQTSQIKQIRAKMVEIMDREASSCDLKDFVGKLIPGIIGKRIEKECDGIFPLHNCFVRKVKVLRAPKYDPQRLMELHTGGPSVIKEGEDAGEAVARDAFEEQKEKVDYHF
eukprot:CAMPEP_0174249834 /NCGR_PEP_ID=MMETSP0439-20130205/165_1 /TAXON_ID=0 /ORGANISM="Stereomyxa ramosa, Strain Chinc5" /LENGTH=261 /DNA_ID=CAMNT_0015329747 /DNA_START=31 /DNA_END=816 /DNA_ORIENTATION=+